MEKILQISAITLSLIGTIATIIYWIIRKKLEEEFIKKTEVKEIFEQKNKQCQERHSALDNQFCSYRSGISRELEDIKSMLTEIRGWFIEFLKK